MLHLGHLAAWASELAPAGGKSLMIIFTYNYLVLNKIHLTETQNVPDL